MTTNQLSSTVAARRTLRNAAFSLVEVVLAVGIMSLGVVTILGLLPHGLNISRDTANELAETRIIDQIVSELQSGDWEHMGGVIDAGATGVRRYFDDQGLEIDPADGTSLDTTLNYVVRVTGPSGTGIAGLQLPGVTGGSSTAKSTPIANSSLRRITIEVVAAPLKDLNFGTPPAGLTVKKFTQLVAKMRVNPSTVQVAQ